MPSHRLHHGVAWYPEHWPEAGWARDLEQMRRLGFTVVRVAEFAWSRLEPSDGLFSLDWLERAVDLAAAHGLDVVIGTPSASPPAWLTQAHPEVLRVEESGRPAGHGARGHFNPASPLYRRFCARIAGEMGRRFGAHPAVIGWQIDNEYWPFSFDAGSRQLFQDWLRGRYGSLEALNTAWSTVYWSQEYSSWDQIPLATSWQNPCLVLAVKRFKSAVIRGYQRAQLDALRPHVRRGAWISHNTHGTFEHADNRDLFADLDLVAHDPYVHDLHLDHEEMGHRNDMARGFKRAPFWVMETIPGHVNWAKLNCFLDPGEQRRVVWHQIAHGADAVLYWWWRAVPGGQEQYHGCLVGQGGELRPFTAEIARLGEEMGRLGPQIAGTATPARVALLYATDDRWAMAEQKQHPDNDPWRIHRAWHSAIRAWGLDVDIVHPDDDLGGYALILAPGRYLIDAAGGAALVAAARAGATVICGPRSGRKDRDNALWDGWQPGGGLAEAMGMRVEEFFALEVAVRVEGLAAGTTTVWAEWLTPTAADTEVVLRYREHAWLDGRAAAVLRPCGAGRLGYLGTTPERETLAAFLGACARQAGLALPAAMLPPGVEACRRRGDGYELLFLLNHGQAAVRLPCPAGSELLGGGECGGSIEVPANDLRIVRSAIG